LNNFDSDRPILRLWETGDVIAGTTVQDMLEYLYFAPPTISTTMTGFYFEVGTTNVLTFTTTTDNPGNATLSSGLIEKTAPGYAPLVFYDDAEFASYEFTFEPIQGASSEYNELMYRFNARQS
jgi:hypothetical protein